MGFFAHVNGLSTLDLPKIQKLAIQDFIAQRDGAEVWAVIGYRFNAGGRDNEACLSSRVGKTTETTPGSS